MLHSIAASELVGTHYYSPLKNDFLTCIDQAAKLGFDGIELHVRSPYAQDYKQLKDRADRKGIKITTIGTGMACHYDGHYLTNPDAVARRKAIQVLKDFVVAAKDCGHAGVMFGLMKGPLPEINQREMYKNILYEALLPVVDVCEKEDCDITLEAVNRFQAAYLWSTAETLDFVERFQSKHVTIHLDSFHMNIEDKSFRDSILSCGQRLGHFHFSDSDRCYPGHGHIDFQEIMQALYDVGYLGNGVGAYEYDSIPDSMTSARLGLENIKQCEATIKKGEK